MKTAKKAALGALAASLVALVAPVTAAHADNPGDTLKGGCSFNTDQNANVENGQNVGTIADLSVSQDGTPPTPSGATVDCWIDVNGSEQPGTRIEASGTGVQANAKQISFTAGPTDAVALCQQVTFADKSPWAGPDGTNPDCPAATTVQIPPQAVLDALNGLLNTVNGVLSSTVDPVICPVLKGLGPQSLAGGLITIGTDGDVSINDPLGLIGKVYDCPPYGN